MTRPMTQRARNNLRAWKIRRGMRRRGFKIYSRRQWGSQAKEVYAFRRNHKPVRVDPADTVVQHITVTRPSGSIKADARLVERIGQERFGSGVSYNYLVDMRTGEIAEGQPLDAKGTHTVNEKGAPGYSYDQNHAARAIAVVGMPDTELTAEAQASIVVLLRMMRRHKAITEDFDYVPHSLFAAKDCPCEPTRSRLGMFRDLVVNRPRVNVREWVGHRR